MRACNIVVSDRRTIGTFAKSLFQKQTADKTNVKRREVIEVLIKRMSWKKTPHLEGSGWGVFFDLILDNAVYLVI